MSNAFTELMKKRRTIYHLGNQLPISEDRVATIIKEAVKESLAHLTHKLLVLSFYLVNNTRNYGISLKIL
ncbi:Uncharacterised protein [Proteus mirabilis]|uniref:Uncharacterized protein n=1 Tax=Proteus mirabilis TaxID=584 RepID=A0A379FIZ2_PROMI|nr:Uncharacterised protein [Proteus mirabilis]